MTEWKIVVASHNPVKANAAKNGFQHIFPEVKLNIETESVESGVSDQPMGDDETRLGAWNRASGAMASHLNADFAIGIEGGCALDRDGMMSVFAWVVVLGPNGQVGQSKTGTFFLPREVATLVRDGMELGDADDRVFGQTNSKQQNGSIGLLTDNVIDRESYYVHAVIMALIPFKNTKFDFPSPHFRSHLDKS